MGRLEHGQARAGLITASVARVVMSGGEGAWDSLVAALWADDGSDFAKASTGARGFGHEQEKVAAGKFWERHPELELDTPEFVMFKRKGFKTSHPYRLLLGVSPDMGLILPSASHVVPPRRIGGGEIKSPTTEGTYNAYVAHMVRGKLPPEHEDQVRYSIFVTGWPGWYFVTHFGPKLYKEMYVLPDADQFAWEARFRPRLDAFIKLYLEGHKPERDKLNAGGLAGLLGK